MVREDGAADCERPQEQVAEREERSADERLQQAVTTAHRNVKTHLQQVLREKGMKFLAKFIPNDFNVRLCYFTPINNFIHLCVYWHFMRIEHYYSSFLYKI